MEETNQINQTMSETVEIKEGYIPSTLVEKIKVNTYYNNKEHDMLIVNNHILKRLDKEKNERNCQKYDKCISSYECTHARLGNKCTVLVKEFEDGMYFIEGTHSEECDCLSKKDIIMCQMKKLTYNLLLQNRLLEPSTIKSTLYNHLGINEFTPNQKEISNMIHNMKSRLCGTQIRSFEEFVSKPLKSLDKYDYITDIIEYKRNIKRQFDEDEFNENEYGSKMLVLVSPFQRLLMKIPNIDLIGDGTFQFVPIGLRQMYSFHMDLFGSTFPITSVFMCEKNYDSYYNLLNYMKLKLELKPHSCIFDYEISARKAFQDVYNESKVFGCYFHYTSAIMKKVKELGLFTEYKKNNDVYLIVKCIISLSFVKLEDVLKYFEIIKKKSNKFEDDLKNKLSKFYEYIHRTWTGKKNSKGRIIKPIFSIKSWNVLCHLDKTSSNEAECFHKLFNEKFNKAHPNIDTVRDILKKNDEENMFKFADLFISKYKELKLNPDNNPFNETNENENNDLLTKIEKAVEIIIENKDLFMVKEEINEEAKEILEINKNFKNGLYGNNEDGVINYLIDIGSKNTRKQILNEKEKLISYLNYLKMCTSEDVKYVVSAVNIRLESLEKMLKGKQKMLLPSQFHYGEDIEIFTELSSRTIMKIKIIDAYHREVSSLRLENTKKQQKDWSKKDDKKEKRLRYKKSETKNRMNCF